jgi:hypothetical protein
LPLFDHAAIDIGSTLVGKRFESIRRPGSKARNERGQVHGNREAEVVAPNPCRKGKV